MLITIEELATRVKCSVQQLKVYLCRAEFSHIKWEKVNKQKISNNVHKDDIQRLRQLIYNRRLKHEKLYFL